MVTFSSLYDALRSAAAGLAVCLCLCLGTGTALRAQDEDKPPEPRPTDLPSLPDVLKEGTLELKARLYLPDGKGTPVFVPQMLLGKLLDMVRVQASRSEGADLPSYMFEELKVEARVGADLAEITARAKVTLNENASPVTAINLRLQSCQLSEPIAFEGSGESRWQVSRNEPGYTWWLRAEPNTSHTATLVGQSVLTSEGDRQSLQLSLPSAPVTIEIHLPPDYQDVRVRGQGGELLRTESREGEQKVLVRCLGGDVNVSWRSGAQSKPVAGAAEANSETRWRIDDPREPWEAESEISLRSYGETTVEVLTLDLPEGAEWLPTPLSLTEQFTITADGPDGSSQSDRSESGSPSASKQSESNSSLPGQSAADKKTAAADVAPAAARRGPVRLRIRAQSRTGLSALESIPIRWRWVPPKSDGEAALTNVAVPSIHVHAVDRHDGTTTLVIPEAYGLEWKSQQGTEFIQQTRVGDIPEQWQYVFRFARQPQGLIVSFRREANLAEVRPTYLAEVDRGKVKLTGWLQCTFDRSQRPELALDLGDWTLDSAEAISDISSPHAEGELLSQQSLPGGLFKLSSDLELAETTGTGRRQRQVWRIVAYRSLNEGSIEHLKLSVPSIMLLDHDGSLAPIDHASGALLMAPSENVLISWDERSSQSLLADAISSEWAALLQGLADRASAYRFQAGAKKSPVWSGRVEVLPRRIAAEQVVVVNIDTETARVAQFFTLQIANEALPQLRLLPRGAQDISVLINNIPCVLEQRSREDDVPAGASQSNSQSGAAADAANGQATPPSDASQSAGDSKSTDSKTGNSSSTDASAGDADVKLVVSGAPKLFGKVVVEIRSQISLAGLAEKSNVGEPTSSTEDADALVIGLPLVKLDLAEAVLGNRAQVSISADRRIMVSLADAGASDAKPLSAAASSNAWSAVPMTTIDIPGDSASLPLRIRRLDEVDPLPVRVSGAWMQTAVSGSTRLDRFCARFSTHQELLAITIPSADLLSLQLTVDGIPVNNMGGSSQGRLQLNLKDVQLDGEHTLEVLMWSANSLRWYNAIDVVPVQIEGCPRFEHFYWQLVTPPSQHLVFVPDSVTPEWRWVWDRFWWHRFSPQDQAYFEQWLGANQEQPLAESANRYVVSTYGPVVPFRCWTASRLLLWLPIGLVAIGCAMAVSIWRVLRHPVSVIVLASAVAAFAVAWPDLAILVGQTSLLALAIVLLYALTQAAVESRVRRRSVFTTRPSSGMFEASDQHSLARVGSHASSEVMATTRTQSPIIADSGGH